MDVVANFMNPISATLRPTLSFSPSSSTFRALCVSALDTDLTPPKIHKRGGLGVKAADAQLKENWLASLSCPSPQPNRLNHEERVAAGSSNLVIGIDPDLSGALAVLRNDTSGCSAEVFDSPTLKVLIGSRVRRRLDAHSIVKLLRSFGAPFGTTAYIEQSTPFPQDGKQGWWAGGFGYGLWIGILVASGFSVTPVPAALWKNEYELSGGRMCKDDSRALASTLFPSMSEHLKRKKDHGRAEALLIAAYGNGIRIKSRVTEARVCDADLELPSRPMPGHTAQASLFLELPESAGAAALV
uniref:Holliday junction resolvase n=1 Tax=Kalanchoe fedtschenkoi TaxID=63787 RepID=A0A7N0UEG7_KALFE